MIMKYLFSFIEFISTTWISMRFNSTEKYKIEVCFRENTT